MPQISRRSAIHSLGLAAPLLVGLHAAGAVTSRTGPIRVAQIGVGHAHASKLSVYRSSGDYQVTAIAEPNEQLRAVAQSQPLYQDLPWMSIEELLNLDDVQVVLVETQVRDLLQTAQMCIDAGKHVHLDKPAGESFPQYQRLLKAASERNLMVQMGYMYRYSPAVVLLRDFLQNGWLGDVFEVHTVMSKVVPADARRQLAEYPGGIMFELGCHVIDLVTGVLGKPLSVTPWHQHAAPIDDQLRDNMLAVFEYDRALATVKSSALEVDGFARRHLTVCGTEGTFHIQPLDNPSAVISLSQDRGQYHKGSQQVAFDKFTRYVGDAADMARIIRGEKTVDFDYDHDLAVQESVLRASGCPIA